MLWKNIFKAVFETNVAVVFTFSIFEFKTMVINCFFFYINLNILKGGFSVPYYALLKAEVQIIHQVF